MKRKSSRGLRGGSIGRIGKIAGHFITPITPIDHPNEMERNKLCHKVNWDNHNINKGTDCMLREKLTDTYDDDKHADTALVAPVAKLQENIEAAIEARDYSKVVELTDEMDRVSPMLYRGMSLDFYRSQGGNLQPKCPDCDTTVKYHIRQGNDADAILSYGCPAESRALGTQTNYISFTEDFTTAVKYATIAGDGLSHESIIAFIHPSEIHDRFDFLKPNESWLEKTTRSSEELECDPAHGIPRKWKHSRLRRGFHKPVGGVRMNPAQTGVSMANASIRTSEFPIRPYKVGTSMTEDWVTHDTEVLVKIKDTERAKGAIPFTDFVKLEGCGLFHITSRVVTREAEVLESLPKDPDSDDINKFEIDRLKHSRDTRQHAPHFLGLRPASISSCATSNGVLTCERTQKPVAMDRPFEGHVPHEFTFRNTQLEDGLDIVITIVEIWDILNQPKSGELEALLSKFEE